MRVDDPAVIVREHRGAADTFLWVLNPTRHDVETTVHLGPGAGDFSACTVRWGRPDAARPGGARRIDLSVPARDGVLLRGAR